MGRWARLLSGPGVDDDAGGDAEVVLDVAAGVGKLRPQPIRLEGADGEMRREGKVGSAAQLQGKTEGIGAGARKSRKDAVEAVGFADQGLAEECERMFARPGRDHTGVARAEGIGDQVDGDAGGATAALVETGDVGDYGEAVRDVTGEFDAAALHPEGRTG